MKFHRLSLCMIVKDEEKYIGQCLASVKDVVDEMIIVDTGSSDRTVEICQSYGAEVVHFPWNGSFSDARNYGLERATGDWILWLDADEEVDEHDAPKLRDTLYSEEDILAIHLMNYYGETVDPNNTFDIAHTRLIRNHKGFKFMNKIHEMLNVNEVITSPEILTIKTVPIKVHHYGYLDSVNEDKKKFERNIKMLELEQENAEYTAWIDYHLASEYYRAKEYFKAFEYVNRSIIGFLRDFMTPPSLLYRLKYSILLISGSIDGAWPSIERAIALYPDYVDLHFYKGLILYLKGMYKEATDAFENCLELGETNLQHLTLKGVGSFQALYYKGCCLEKQGHIIEAAKLYAEAATQSPNFKSPREDLRKIVMNHPDIFGDIQEDCEEHELIAMIKSN